MSSTLLKRKTDTQIKRPSTSKRTVKSPYSTDVVAIIHKRFIEGHPELEAYLVEERERHHIGQQIYDLRTNSKMSYAALAKKVGITKEEMARLEDSDYEVHDLPLLRKIAAVFGMKLELNFTPVKKIKKVKQ
jgi:DNA-binding XRE family transcriptional regulator